MEEKDMRIYLKLTVIGAFLSLLFILPVMAQDGYNPASGYHNYSALTKALKDLADRNTKIAELTSIGQTLKGKDIWALQISGTQGGKPEDKQALLICGNLEGDHVIGSEVALGIADYLIGNYGNDDEVTKVLDTRTFYIIPRLNPDGAEIFFDKLLAEHPGNLKPRDEDYDWRIDEDGPEDLNGDGMITVMRVKDKEGDWLIDKKDPRLLRKKEADTPVESLYQIYPEGIDNDGDERYNEDGPGGFNINRNFPHNFGYKIKGPGVYAASEIETKSLIDFMNKYIPDLKTQPHKNISGVFLFSKYDNLAASPGIECGEATFPEVPDEGALPISGIRMRFRRPSDGEQTTRRPARDPQPKKTEEKDTHLFKNVSEKYKEITGIKSAESEKPVGSFLEWAYFQYGVPAFSSNLWSLRKEEADTTRQGGIRPGARPDQGGDRTARMRQFAAGRTGAAGTSGGETKNLDENWLKWIDKDNEGKGFLKWEPFQHKQLGEVEIGGFLPYLRINPPADQIAKLSESHAKFALHLTSQFAEITMDEPEIEKMSSNLFRLKIKVHNKGKFPYATAMGQRSRNVTPIILRLKFEDDENMKLFGGAKRNDLQTLEGGAEKEYQWVIISPPNKKIDITLWARKGGGTFKKRVVLR